MAKTKKTHDISYTQNRELSWLKFNERVLAEAQDETVPLYERLKFVSIFESNLDEFFMVRVGSLFDLSIIKSNRVDNKSGLTPSEQLKKIFKAVKPLYKQKDNILANIEKQLELYDISRMQVNELEHADRKFIHQYFTTYVLPVLSPQVVDVHHPFPHLANKSLYIAVMFENGENNLFGIIPVPQILPKVVFLPGNSLRFVLMENIILEYANAVFDKLKIADKTIITVTRNEDISPADEDYHEDDDYLRLMKKILKKRKRLAPVRLEVQNTIGQELADYLCERLQLKKEQVYISAAPLIMSYVFALQDKLSPASARALSYPAFEPQPSPSITKGESVMQQVLNKDLLLHYPYEQMEPFLRLIKEAAHDDSVISIKITIYRLASTSKLVEYLTEAAENNKDVTVLVELRARFDEQNNIDWAEVLEEAGCTVIYGIENYKVHTKICLITRWKNDKVQYITQIGTGNYSEKTARLYTDLCLITANQEIGMDASTFFKNMAVSNLEGQYFHMLVAPTSLKTGIIALIDREITKTKAGQKGKIVMKMNSLTDRAIITKLSEASCAGVEIQLIIRGICCLVPQIEGKTDNIMVQSIIGRYLEHARIYCFGEGKEQAMYISSADIMTRNTEKRVEIACPIYDEQVKTRINNILNIMLQDNVKARVLQHNAQYTKKIIAGNPRIDCQAYFMEEAITATKEQQTHPNVEIPKQYPPKGSLRKLWTKLKEKGSEDQHHTPSQSAKG
mgnify:CR=1 FL=1